MGVLTGATVSGANPSLELSVTTPKSDYVVGEPVALNFSMANTGQDAVRVSPITGHEHPHCPEFAIYIAREGEKFDRYRPPCLQAARPRRALVELKPGESLRGGLRILATGVTPVPVISAPGKYRVKVVHPHYPEAEMEAITLRVAEPEGLDAKLWSTMQSEEFLYFLHWGAVAKESSDSAFLAAEIVRSHSNSSYHGGLRWALGEYYRSRPDLDPHEMELIRKAAGIPAPAPHPLASDARLDQVVTYHFPEEVPLGTAVQKLSQQSHISLNIDADLADRGVSSDRNTAPLREFMKRVAVGGAQWFRDGDGYLLSPAGRVEDDRAREKSSPSACR